MSDLRGFNYSNVTLRKVKKNEFVLSQELEQQVSRDELKRKICSVLNNNGKVYFISKKRWFVVLPLFGMRSILHPNLSLKKAQRMKPKIWGPR